jgi:hypothetical protein
MKKHIVVAAGLAVLSTGAFATVARMTALNQDANQGSYYIDDERNVFRSAGDFSGNYVYFEHGSNGATGDTHGGIFREGGSMSYGLYIGSDINNNLAGVGTVQPARFDLFLKGNSGMNWGVRLGYESITADAGAFGAGAPAADSDGSTFDFSVNAELGGANVWLSMAPATDNLTGGDGTESDMQIGASMEMADHTLFAEYDSEGGVANADAQTRITVGAARTHSTDSGMWFYDVSLNMTTAENNVDGVDRTTLPVTIGFETKATSWLTWRASLQQSIFGSLDSNGTEASARTATLGVGASLTWGSLRVDGAVSGANTAAGAGTLGSDGFMSNVSAVYRF